MTTETTAVLAFAFGMTITVKADTRPIGLLCGIAEALQHRGELDDLLDRLDPFMAARLRQAICLDRAALRAQGKYRH
jgi:hypothetical protein